MPKKKTTVTNSQTSRSTDWIGIAKKYAETAAKDTKNLKHCRWVVGAAQRFLDDLKKRDKKKFPFYLCPIESAKVCNFFQLLPHIEGNWETKTLILEPWQVFILVNIFGWRRYSDGRRRFDTVYLEVARKNAKSTFASGIGLYCLMCEEEIGPQVKCAATTGDQARIVFEVAKKMVEKTPKMIQHFKLSAFTNVIACYKSGGNFKPINAKSSTQDGLNPHCSIIDELHAHQKRDLFDVLRSARGARKNPLSFYITTAGYNTLGVCFEQHNFSKKILQNLITADHYFCIIFTLDENDDPLDETKWVKANPNLNVSVQLKEMQDYAIEAYNSPETMSEFKTKRLNVWTTAKNGYISIPHWKLCDAPVDLDILKNVPCWGAFDLASVSDLNAFMLAWKLDDIIYTWGRFYLPEDVVMGRTEKNGIPYKTWVEQGYIQPTPGNVTDYAYIEKDILDCMERFNVRCVAYDPWNATDIAQRLAAEEVPVIEFRQGPQSYNAPMREIERVVLSKKFAHGGNPVLAWNASNVVARRDVNTNLAPDKKNSFEKIDGYVALAMAIGLMIKNENGQTEGASVYDQRGLIEI